MGNLGVTPPFNIFPIVPNDKSIFVIELMQNVETLTVPNIRYSLIERIYFVIFLYWVSTLLSRVPSLSCSSAMMAGGGAGRGGVGSS